jgi:hypothetical protein
MVATDSDTDRPTDASTDAAELTVPADATPAQTAAIAAAIGAHVRDQRVAAALAREESNEDTWDGNRFQFAGRLEGLTGCPRRVPRGAPTDKWTATGRRDRYGR